MNRTRATWPGDLTFRRVYRGSLDITGQPRQYFPTSRLTGRGRCAPRRVRAVRPRNAVPTRCGYAETSHLAASRSASESGKCTPGEAPSCGGWGREGVRSEARAEQRLAPGGRAALPLTRTKHWRAALPLTRTKHWRAALPLTRNECIAYFSGGCRLRRPVSLMLR